MMIVERLEAMQRQDSGQDQTDSRMMGMFMQMMEKMNEIAERASAPIQIVRDPRTGMVLGGIKAQPSGGQRTLGGQ